MEQRALTREQSRALDRRAIEEFGIPGLVLMENAGRGCVNVLERVGIADGGPVVILCGRGNNAGDGFVIARHLTIRGYTCKLALIDTSSELSGDAATNYGLLDDTFRVEFPPVAKTWPSQVIHCLLDGVRKDADWLVDAMLGTGAKGEPRPPYDAAIDWMNAQLCKKLAVDLPSGLDCDTGQPAHYTVRADHTCTFAAMKTGFTQPAAKPFLGTIHVCDIGLPPRLIASTLAQPTEK